MAARGHGAGLWQIGADLEAADQLFWRQGRQRLGILTYSGHFQTRDGRRVVYAFMQQGADQSYTMPNTRRAFAWINARIEEVLGPVPPTLPLKSEGAKRDDRAAQEGKPLSIL